LLAYHNYIPWFPKICLHMSPIFSQFGWLYSLEIFRDPAIRRVSSFSAGTMMVAPGFLGSNVGTVRRYEKPEVSKIRCFDPCSTMF
jgi:hypothetical protein